MSRVGNLSARIFVGGLDPAVEEPDLEKAFKLFGEITNVMVLRDRENGRSRGFAFISFKDSCSSEEAISRMHGVEIRGRCVSVRHAEREKHFDDRAHQNNARFMGNSGRSAAFQAQSYTAWNSYQIGRSARFSSDRVFITDDYGQNERDIHPRRSRSPLHNASRRYEKSPPRRVYSAKDQIVSDDGHYRSRKVPSHERYESPVNEEYRYEDQDSLSPARERTAYINSRARNYSPLLRLDSKTKERRDRCDTIEDEFDRRNFRSDSPPAKFLRVKRGEYCNGAGSYARLHQSARNFSENQWQTSRRKDESPVCGYRFPSPKSQEDFRSKASHRGLENIDSFGPPWSKQPHSRSSKNLRARDNWPRQSSSVIQGRDERKGDWSKELSHRSPREHDSKGAFVSKNSVAGDLPRYDSRRDEWRKSPANRNRRFYADLPESTDPSSFERAYHSRDTRRRTAVSYEKTRECRQGGRRDNCNRSRPSRYQDDFDSKRPSSNYTAGRRGQRQSGNEGRTQLRPARDRSPATGSPASSRRY